MKKLEKIYLSTYFLISLKEIRNDLIFNNFLEFLKSIINEEKIEPVLDNYNKFLISLNNKDFSVYLREQLLKIEISTKEIKQELNILSDFSKIDFNVIKEILLKKFKNYSSLINNMPEFKNSKTNFSKIKTSEIKQADNIFDLNRTFIFDNEFKIIPIDTHESLCFYNLKGYEYQKRVLYDNTKALINGFKVNNILLYGDAGCGKSSSVRALLNEFSEIKIVQIFKNNLINLDKLYSKLEKTNYKFIIFADDITFNDNDENLSTMKAILEGSLIQCPKNAVIYATSNRKHLIKESFKSRMGDEIHLNDTLNEINSLSERFGINLLFLKPNQDEFVNIVLQLAKDSDLKIEEKILIEKAKKYALQKGSRNPRTIKQFINNLAAKIDV